MNLLQEIEQIPMINDHTHIFGCGVPTYEEAGRSAIFDTPEDVLIGLSSMNMNETVFLGKEPQEVRKLLLQLYDGRKTTYPGLCENVAQIFWLRRPRGHVRECTGINSANP